MSNNAKLEKIAVEFIFCFEEGDFDRMRALMQPSAKSYITNAKAGVSLFDGRDAFIQNLVDLNVKEIKPKVQVDQVLTTAPNQVMIMFEGVMHKGDKKFHNIATYLIDFEDDLIKTIQMVEAQPQASDVFWKSDN